ncbi:J domain-containing protein, partial [Kineosporia rhizophila]|uniref:J domain-containing protein n=1 Tax=Kineosporia rhizophila TaxID=84633 RepID=UPI001E32E2C4|nr:J domain-containing protein [Kineosporia rhizophila]
MISARFHELDGRSAYQVLGVFETAGPEEVNKAYRRRMRELHPDLGGGQGDPQEAQHVSIAHRWLTRHRSEYERFVFDRRRDDPQWGRVLAPVVPDSPPRTSPGTGSFRTVAQERMAERAAEWAERQQRDGRGSRAGWRAPRVAAPWGETAEPTDDRRGDSARWAGGQARQQWERDGEGRRDWASGPPTAEQTLLEVSRAEVARRREQRLQADAARRATSAAGSAGSEEVSSPPGAASGSAAAPPASASAGDGGGASSAGGARATFASGSAAGASASGSAAGAS